MTLGRPVATVVIPTHDHAALLDLSVGSVLAQTVVDLEVVVVGDGAGDDTREVMSALCRRDDRVRFLDLPKGPNHGEVHRGRAVAEASGEVVCYLSDDDVLLPEHVADMVDLLAGADLAHCMNGYVDPDGIWYPCIGDLADPFCRHWVLRPDCNFVSLTGAAHTKAAYARLPHGWRTTPAGRWPDHYMWQEFLGQSWVRSATSRRVTALQFPSHLSGRGAWTADQRRAEVETFLHMVSDPAGRADFDHMTRLAVMRHAAPLALLAADRLAVIQRLEEELAAERAVARAAAEETECSSAQAAEEAARGAVLVELAAVRRELAAVQATRTWRVRSALLRIPALGVLARLTAGRGRSASPSPSPSPEAGATRPTG